MSAHKAVSAMTKLEMAHELISYDLDPRPEWTLVELRELVKSEREARGRTVPRPRRTGAR
eukprot:7054035-Alexandrium_andersonii.AAC.1